MIDVFVLDNDDNDVDNAASRLNIKCIDIDSRHCSRIRDPSFEINNNSKDCRLSIQSCSLSSEDFDDNSSCDNVDKKDNRHKSKQQREQQHFFPVKGILKYPFDWNPNNNNNNTNRQNLNNSVGLKSPSVSGPSSLDSDDQGYYGTSCESPDSAHYLSPLIYQSCEKKHVTWSEKDVVFVFRKGSSILGCRKKNQKKAKRKLEKARLREEEENACNAGQENGTDSDIESVRVMIANQRFSVHEVNEFDSVSDASSSGCDCSTSEASGDDEEVIRVQSEPLNYLDEKTFEGNSNKQKRKRQRKRNRKSKQNVRNRLETGYDSDS